MKTILLAMATAAIAFSPGSAAPTEVQTAPAPQAVQADASQAPARAPDMPVTPPVAPAAPKAASALATLGTGTPPAQTSGDRWSDLDDTHRYLLIMGSVDGYAAAGTGAPCFPGNDNTGLDSKLKQAGFTDADPATLPEAMAKIAAPKEQCTGTQMRGYGNKLLKTMPDDHLATYLTGVVRAYSRIKACPAKAQGYAAATVTAAIFTGSDEAQPVTIIAPALVEGCKGPA